MMRIGHFFPVLSAAMLLLSACAPSWNDPYPVAEAGQNIFYAAFAERPKHLDPAIAYTADEYDFLGQIYEPPLQYHYLKRPYTLIPATVETVPVPQFLDAAGKSLPSTAPVERIAFSVYELKIRPGIRYQPHPAFAVDAAGQPRYLGAEVAQGRQRIRDFAETGTRELVADDYIYQIKRLAHPRLHSPIFGMMADKIIGLKALGEALQKEVKTLAPETWLDLDRFSLSGVEKVDRYTFRIRLQGKYPQFQYWLAMPFFSPMPREVDRFFAQPGMKEKNLVLDWWPVGTGAYMLSENDPNRRMVLSRNPNFHGATYPCEGEAGDAAAGLLADCGKALPFVDQAVFTREKEAIPYWNKFLQGYYDASGISSDSFDQAVRINVGGDVGLSDEMLKQGITLQTAVKTSTFYMGFNMQDGVVGGLDEKAAKLRQAISIAIDQEEFISIFQNGRGLAAQGLIPPGIFGFEEGRQGMNPFVYDWVDGRPKRKSVDEAKRLLAEAGYPNGRYEKTGEPLVLSLDTTSGGMGEKSRLDWLTRQFQKIDVQLVVRSTDFNRFQDKLRKGNVQLYYLGWNADYPDPENFYFLLDGNEGKVSKGGENASNYTNPAFDQRFAAMKNMENSPARLSIIRELNRIVQHDAPWVFGLHPKAYSLTHGWLKNVKPGDVGHNTLMYKRLDVRMRSRLRSAWNTPALWPLFLFATVFVIGALWGVSSYRRRDLESMR